jgi:hypothetical protein
MLCEHVQRAITESLAAGAELPREIRSHAEACPACRARLESESALFTALDAGLRARAGSELPAGFLHRVRARLAEAPARRALFSPAWTAALSLAAIVLVAGLALRVYRLRSFAPPDNTPPVAGNIASAQTPQSAPVPARENSPGAASVARSRSPRKPAAQLAPGPGAEVLVSQEDRMAWALLVRNLARASALQRETLAAALTRAEDAPPIRDLSIAPLELRLLPPEASEPDGVQR